MVVMQQGGRAARAAFEGKDDPGPRTRATIFKVLVIVLGVAWLALGVAVYRFEANYLATVAAAEVALFAIVDLWIRPRSEAQGMQRVRHYLPLWALMPSLLALMTSAWVQYRQWQRSLDDIHELAAEVNCAPAFQQDGITSRTVEDAVREVTDSHFPGRRTPASKPSSTQMTASDGDNHADEKRRFIELARVIGHDLVLRCDPRTRQGADPAYKDGGCGDRSCKDDLLPDALKSAARDDTWSHLCLAFCVQALFVLWIPFLLVISIGQAKARLMEGTRETTGVARAGLSHLWGVPATPALRCALDQRDRHILGEEHAYFVPRLCFAALLLLGTMYVFAPFGLRTSSLMSLVEAHALPGHTSFVLWCNHFASAPVITTGFVGFLIYALITATQRFVERDLDDLAIFSLLVRGLVVILLSLALSSEPFGDIPTRLLVFLAGVFPIRVLEAIAKRANVSLDPEFASESDPPRSFVGLPSLDPAKVFALRAAGIHSTYDLAAMPIEEIVGRVRIDPNLLGRAVDRAILIDAMGPDLVTALEPHAITSATELVAVARTGLPVTMAEALGAAARLAAARLADDQRIDKLEEWLGCSPHDAQHSARER